MSKRHNEQETHQPAWAVAESKTAQKQWPKAEQPRKSTPQGNDAYTLCRLMLFH